jgi:hypothetical protein
MYISCNQNAGQNLNLMVASKTVKMWYSQVSSTYSLTVVCDKL